MTGRTASHLRALNPSDGTIACIAIHVHTDTDTIALVLAINEKCCEPGMGLHRPQKSQGGKGSFCRRNMHLGWVGISRFLGMVIRSRVDFFEQ